MPAHARAENQPRAARPREDRSHRDPRARAGSSSGQSGREGPSDHGTGLDALLESYRNPPPARGAEPPARQFDRNNSILPPEWPDVTPEQAEQLLTFSLQLAGKLGPLD